jgi:hypothetical protein
MHNPAPHSYDHMQITCFAVQATPLAGGLFATREASVLDSLRAQGGVESISTHAEMLSLAAAPHRPPGEAFPTLTELLQQFGARARAAGTLKADMPLARSRRRDVGTARSLQARPWGRHASTL